MRTLQVSGRYKISVSLGGVLLPGCPYSVLASTPTPLAPLCVLKGSALTRATARKEEVFEVSFKDSLGQVAHAQEVSMHASSLP